VTHEIAPRLARLRAAEVSAGELREEVADLKEAVDGLAAEVAEVRRAVRARREERDHSTGGGQRPVPVRLLFGWAAALASLTVGVYAAVWQERAKVRAS
jgi:hypothetical protein